MADGVKYDGSQAEKTGAISHSGSSTPDYGGINFDNTQIDFGSVKMSINDDMYWCKKNGVFFDPTKKFKDVDAGDAKEVSF